ncbi:MAG: hypothetical protein A2X85_08810 [Geobacteraceae bacterium GWF2_54_21]|nr:MAG: hypothetical protein A2X85_08810 [Geobacteraceae bacterium GWF2_54_21]
MTPFKNRLKTPEEIELEHKYQKLARLKTELQRHEQLYSSLKSEIRMFEQVYEDILGTRIEALEDLEWQLQGLLGEEALASSAEAIKHEPAFAHFHHTTDLLDDEDSPPNTAEISLKSLYRGVAKAVHPDLASDEADRGRRQELMALANEAYQTGNRQVLADLLSEWEQTPVFNSDLDIAMELVRVIRQIALVDQNIHAMIRQTEELKQTDIYLFKLRVDESLADGIDLMAEMAAKVDMDIARICRRLMTLRGEGDAESGPADLPFETRIIRFPVDQSCGTLYVRRRESLDYRDWQQLGSARGAKEVYLDKSLRLDVKGGNGIDISFLAGLQSNDLQSLFLYNVDDDILPNLVHLTGLQELYISDARISNQGLALLRPLKELQRISIYHTAIDDQGLLNLALIAGLKWLTCSGTSITEDGLNLFRRVMPGCKAVSFKWRYEGTGKTN